MSNRNRFLRIETGRPMEWLHVVTRRDGDITRLLCGGLADSRVTLFSIVMRHTWCSLHHTGEPLYLFAVEEFKSQGKGCLICPWCLGAETPFAARRRVLRRRRGRSGILGDTENP